MKKGIIWIIPWIIFLLATGVQGCSRSDSVLKIAESEIQAEQEHQPSPDPEKREEMKEEPKVSWEETEQEMIYVEVCGAVGAPGVYQMPKGSRVFQAVDQAGGLRGDAVPGQVNQAEEIYDGQQIRIYTVEEMQQEKEQTENIQQIRSDGKVDLNRADKALLMTLTGIGETRADAILAYREKQGKFSTIEELMQVEGIKEKTYEKLKNQITVS